MSAGNVVQLGVCNEHGLPVAEAASMARMDCAGGELLAMGAAAPATLAGIAQGVTGDQVRAAACHGAADVQSAVFVTSYEGSTAPCHTPCHGRASLEAEDPEPEAGPQAELGRVAGAETDRGGGGSGARARACCTIGLGAAENFRNGSSSRRTPAPKKEGGAVEAVRPYGRKAVFARVVRTGQIVLVKLGRGLHAERFPFPCWLQAQQVDGAWIYAGSVPEPRCPQCLSRHNTDCYEQPCGWSEKKKGGAA